ncbi:unnamed protein product [Oikopleura dioica]|uniref:Peptidase M16 middle/third domain-containing protein n=1 Tax=Oikopleura dioica TaxID=34765 RepID=E4YAT9_OIKDI|nr:unnamed protein product [Oikopleura dioica]
MHQRRFFGTKCWLGYTPFQFNNDTINKCLREIKPSNCAVLLRSQSFAGEGGFEEPAHSYPREFRLPEENKYVIKNLPQKVDDSQSWPAPKRVLRSSTAELWFKTDSKFNIPRAYICVNFLTNLASKNIKNQVMMDMLLFATAGQCQGSHDFTLASEAGIECRVLGIFADAAQDNRVTNNTRPVGIMVSGYDPKLPEIILRAMDMLLKFRLHNMDILGQLINQLQGAYQGTMIGDPLRVCSELGTRLLINNYYSLPERLEFTRDILRSDFGLLQQFIMEFHQFQQQLITKSYYQVHIEGNMTQKEATDIYKQITKLAQAKGPGSLKVKSATSGPKIRNHEMPVACKVAGMDPNSEMTFCSLTWVLGKFQSSRRLSALATFVSSMMHQPAFDYLRTKKALGYIAGSREWSRSGVKEWIESGE